MTIPITPELRAAHDARRAAIERANRSLFVRSCAGKYVGEFATSSPLCTAEIEALRYDFARIAANMLTEDRRLALAIHLTDNLEGFDDDARNDAVDALGRMI